MMWRPGELAFSPSTGRIFQRKEDNGTGKVWLEGFCEGGYRGFYEHEVPNDLVLIAAPHDCQVPIDFEVEWTCPDCGEVYREPFAGA